MEDYICIGGQKVGLPGDLIERFKGLFPKKDTRLGDLAPAESFRIGEHELVVLEHCCGTTAVIYKGLLHEAVQFSSGNNRYDGSNVDNLCIQFGVELAALIGVENLVEFGVDLTSDDGLNDYGSVVRKVSLLTTEQYRKYVDILDQHKVDDYWWLVTPHSTARHGNESWVKCVAPGGRLNFYICYVGGGVRPFCILKSDIFVSR